MITQQELKELFVYERHGMLRRRDKSYAPYPWRKIGTNGKYLATTLAGKTYYLHRLIWLYHKGVMPKRVDHRDNDQSNNRIGNLRECTNAQNQYNSKRKYTNRSGFKGVVEHKKCTHKKWQAKIGVEGKTVSLGYYASPEEAGAAYARGAKKYALKFARTG